MWKIAGSSQKYATYEEAAKAAGIEVVEEKPVPVEEKPKEWSPLDMLRGKKLCDDCGEDPCVCEEEWNSAEEI